MKAAKIDAQHTPGPLQLDGKDLRVGDTIETWWAPGRDTITELRPYRGPLAYLWPEGARIAAFALFKVGMTIEPQADFVVLNRVTFAHAEDRP